MTARPVPHGTADALARLMHFRQLTDANSAAETLARVGHTTPAEKLPDAHELDPVIRFLLGSVGDTTQVLEHIADELETLYALIIEDYDDDQLDELTDDDWARHSFATQQQEVDHRHQATVTRLVADIEGHIALHRLIHAENQRTVAS